MTTSKMSGNSGRSQERFSGKAKSPTEFGAKVSIIVINGYTFVNRISFDADNEGEVGEFVRTVENYRRRFGRYPERVLANKLYRSRANRAFCKKHGIRISGLRLGRPSKDYADELRQDLKEISEWNAVEGKFGNGKRKFNLARIMAKLKEASNTMIMIDVFVLNMEWFFRQGGVVFMRFLRINYFLSFFRAEGQSFTADVIVKDSYSASPNNASKITKIIAML